MCNVGTISPASIARFSVHDSLIQAKQSREDIDKASGVFLQKVAVELKAEVGAKLVARYIGLQKITTVNQLDGKAVGD